MSRVCFFFSLLLCTGPARKDIISFSIFGTNSPGATSHARKIKLFRNFDLFPREVSPRLPSFTAACLPLQPLSRATTTYPLYYPTCIIIIIIYYRRRETLYYTNIGDFVPTCDGRRRLIAPPFLRRLRQKEKLSELSRQREIHRRGISLFSDARHAQFPRTPFFRPAVRRVSPIFPTAPEPPQLYRPSLNAT